MLWVRNDSSGSGPGPVLDSREGYNKPLDSMKLEHLWTLGRLSGFKGLRCTEPEQWASWPKD